MSEPSPYGTSPMSPSVLWEAILNRRFTKPKPPDFAQFYEGSFEMSPQAKKDYPEIEYRRERDRQEQQEQLIQQIRFAAPPPTILPQGARVDMIGYDEASNISKAAMDMIDREIRRKLIVPPEALGINSRIVV